MTLSDPVLLAVLGGIGTGFLMLIRWLKEDRDFWRDQYMETRDQSEVATEMAERHSTENAGQHDQEQLSPKASDAAQRIIVRARRRRG